MLRIQKLVHNKYKSQLSIIKLAMTMALLAILNNKPQMKMHRNTEVHIEDAQKYKSVH
jgi:hypothetical protein